RAACAPYDHTLESYMSLLSLFGVGFDLPDRPLLDDVSLALAAGVRIALVGENGAGKTTLMRIALGELEPVRGRVERRGAVAWLPQDLEPGTWAPGSGGERQRERLEALLGAT